MSSEQNIPEEQIRAVVQDELENNTDEVIESIPFTRRDILRGVSILGLGAAGAGLGTYGAIGRAAAQTSSGSGTIGTSDNPLEAIYVDQLYQNEDNITATSVSTERTYTGSRPVHTVVHEVDGTIYADGPSGSVASGSDPHSVINTALSNAPDETVVQAVGRLPASSTTIELADQTHFHFDHIAYSGTGYAIEAATKGSSYVTNVVVNGNRIQAQNGSGVDLDSVIHSHISVSRISGSIPPETGTVGFHGGNPGTNVASWWNFVECNHLVGFDRGIHTESAANRLAFDVAHIVDCGVHDVDFDNGYGIFFRFMDLQDGSESYMRVNADGCWGEMVSEGSSDPNVAVLHIDSGANDYDITVKDYGSAAPNLQKDSDSGVLRDLSGTNTVHANNFTGALNTDIIRMEERSIGGNPDPGQGWFYVDDGSGSGEGDLRLKFTQLDGTTKDIQITDFSTGSTA